jgi:hypothetical protein
MDKVTILQEAEETDLPKQTYRPTQPEKGFYTALSDLIHRYKLHCKEVDFFFVRKTQFICNL